MVRELRRGLPFFALLLLFLPLRAADEQVYDLGPGITPPKVTHQVAPEHPAQGFRISGTVLIGLVVSSKGEPTEVHVLRSLEKEVDQSAMDAVKQWQFEPARKNGDAVAVKVQIEIRFHDM
jgi:TonB family protein